MVGRGLRPCCVPPGPRRQLMMGAVGDGASGAGRNAQRRRVSKLRTKGPRTQRRWNFGCAGFNSAFCPSGRMAVGKRIAGAGSSCRGPYRDRSEKARRVPLKGTGQKWRFVVCVGLVLAVGLLAGGCEALRLERTRLPCAAHPNGGNYTRRPDRKLIPALTTCRCIPVEILPFARPPVST